MLKSRLYWKVLANFALLLIILTAMTVLTLNILQQIEKNFNVAAGDTRSLGSVEKVRHFLADVPAAAYEYALTQSLNAKVTYEAGWKEFDFAVEDARKDLNDSSSVKDLMRVRDLYHGWMENVGDKMMLLPEQKLPAEELHKQLGAIAQVEFQIQYIGSARNLIRDVFQRKLSTQPLNIERATSKSRDLGLFIGLVNVLLALFAVALGFVLTRSITTPVRLLKEGTERIMSGTYETIELHRNDELGNLADAFNKMAIMLGNNYTRLKAYSELVTTLNTIEALNEVESKSLQLLCEHTASSLGALYILNKDSNTLDLVSTYGFKGRKQATQYYQIGEGIPGQCAQEQKLLEFTDIAFPNDFIVSTGLFDLVPKSIMAVPIVFQEKILGVLVLGSLRQFTDSEKEIISNSVPQISVAITNAMNNDATRNLSLEIAQRNDELNAKNSELEKLYRVKSDFLASMSHELRTPLNSIIGFSSVLIGPNGDPLTRDQRMAIEKVLKNGKHLLQLINDILDLSKLESGRMSVSIESEDVPSVVSNCVMTVEPLVKSKGVALTYDIEPNLPVLSTDIVKVRQILVNLLSNAAKFTEQGEVSIKVFQKNGLVHFAVKDSGIGIEEKNLGLIFEEFRQVDSSNTRKYKGTGLGLPIARKLAIMLEGDLTVQSVYGNGSTFTLAIPPVYPAKKGPETVQDLQKLIPKITQQPQPQLRPENGTPLSNVAKGLQILCIDDDPDVIEILRKYLVPEGYSVAGALSGDEGIAFASRNKPALITLDIMMPKKDGWQVLRELKQNDATKDIPVVIHSIIDNKPLAMTLGAVDVMTKPTDPSRLLNLIKQFCKSNDQSILVVDDNQDFAEAVRALIKRDGFNVKTASGGKEALEILKTSSPALIILDLLMPGMDGFQVVQQLQANDTWKKIPVVILTGKELTAEELAMLNKHVTEFMKKDDLTHLDISSTVKKILSTHND
ncbi:MAG: response regulator [Bacteroidota bacterium]